MDLSQLEAAVNASQDPSNPALMRDATVFLNSFHANPEGWKVGMQLLVNSCNNVAKLFGLRLVMKALSESDSAVSRDLPSVGLIRNGLWDILRRVLADPSTSCPQYLSSMLVTTLILCAKLEFPHQWPTAFNDIIGLSTFGWTGIDIAVRMISEFDTECVNNIYSESRTKADFAHITRVKDAMRSNSTVADIVTFLCQVATQARSLQKIELTQMALVALSQLVSWIDIALFNEKGLPTVYDALKDNSIRGSAFACLQEVVAKGMDPYVKLELLASINFFDAISQCGISLSEDDDTGLAEFGSLLNITLLLLLECWNGIQGVLIKSALNRPVGDEGAIVKYAPPLAGYIRGILQSKVIPLFSHADSDVFSILVPSLNKVISLLNTQVEANNAGAIAQIVPTFPQFFLVSEFVDQLLVAIFKVIQYPEDFNFEADDDDAEVIEAVDEVKKLFVNILKVAPASALTAVTSLLNSLPQPLSRSPFCTLEASLRMLYSFGEAGKAFASIEPSFVSIVKAIHCSDVANHSNPYVLLQYFELSIRFFKYIDIEKVPDIMRVLTGPKGLRHSNPTLANRCAYLFLQCTKVQLAERSVILLPVIPTFSNLILSDGSRRGNLSTTSEIYLIEAISCIIFSEYDKSASTRALQNQLLQDMSQILVAQLNQLVSNPIFAAPEPQDDAHLEVAAAVAHKISCISSLAQNYSAKVRPDISTIFTYCGSAIVSVCRSTGGGFPLIREKTIQYFKSMVSSSIVDCLKSIGDVLDFILPITTESDELDICFTLVDFCMTRFKTAAFPLIQLHYQSLLQKNEQVLLLKLQDSGILDGSLKEVPGINQSAMQVNETSRLELQVHQLKLLRDASENDCFGVFNAAAGGLDFALSIIKSGILGGRYLCGYTLKLQLRKLAVETMNSLCRLTQRFFQHSQDANASPTAFPGIDVALLQRIIAWEIKEGLNLMFQACIDRHSIQMADLHTQVFLTEFGSLLFALYKIDSASTTERLVSLFQTQGWPADKANNLYALLQAAGTSLSAEKFSEQFKLFMRSLI